jgi:tyrosine-protein kinase Etk/Wzc
MNNSYKPATFSDIVRLLIRKYKLLFILPLLIASVTAIATLYMDDIYKSSASLLPAEERKIGLESLLGGNLGGMASSLIGGGGRRSTFDRYLVLLNSESVKIEVIEKFNLIEYYEMEDIKYPLLRTMEKLDNNTNFRGQTEGNFLIEVWDKDPELAFRMVEFYVDILSRFNNQISLREATAYREFVEQRYRRAFNDVDSLRITLAEFQRKYGVYELSEQVIAYFTLLGEVTVEQMQTELALDLLESTVGTNNSTYKQAKQRLEAINRNLERTLVRSDTNPLFLNMEQLPDISREYFELMQNIELQSEILKFIVPMYEQAMLEEQKALPIVSVVDRPRISDKKDKPFRALIVIAVLLSSFLVIAVTIILQHTYIINREYFQSLIKE